MSLHDPQIAGASLEFARELAREAGKAALPYFRAGVAVDHKPGKGDFDPVTKADREAEQVMRAMIAREYPDHNIKGEEYGFEDKGSAFTWVLDPVDGTRSFIMGVPVWGTIVGLTFQGKAIAGVMSQPYTGEIFSGNGKVSRLTGPQGGRDLHVRPCRSLADAALATTDIRLFANASDARAYARLEEKVLLSRYGGDCYIYCMLAAGQIDLVVETGLADYDIAGLIPIVEGAGGIITNWEGGNAAGGGQVVAAGDADMHKQALAILAG
jgi:myo-inositol-1(or 4)-monophosphatase